MEQSIDRGNLRAVEKYPASTNVKKVKQWLGLVDYYRHFITDFARIAEPLAKLLRKGNFFTWIEEQIESLRGLKDVLCSDVVLNAPGPNQPFLVTIDRPDYVISAVLSQRKMGEDRPCAFASRALNGAELCYSIYDKEFSAVVFAGNQFRHYLYGKKFTVITNHQPLKHLNRSQKPDHQFGRLQAELHGEMTGLRQNDRPGAT